MACFLRESQDRAAVLSLATHPRLGATSPLALLDQSLLRHLCIVGVPRLPPIAGVCFGRVSLLTWCRDGACAVTELDAGPAGQRARVGDVPTRPCDEDWGNDQGRPSGFAMVVLYTDRLLVTTHRVAHADRFWCACVHDAATLGLVASTSRSGRSVVHSTPTNSAQMAVVSRRVGSHDLAVEVLSVPALQRVRHFTLRGGDLGFVVAQWSPEPDRLIFASTSWARVVDSVSGATLVSLELPELHTGVYPRWFVRGAHGAIIEFCQEGVPRLGDMSLLRVTDITNEGALAQSHTLTVPPYCAPRKCKQIGLHELDDGRFAMFSPKDCVVIWQLNRHAPPHVVTTLEPLAALIVLRSVLRHSPVLLAPAERLLVSAAPAKWPASPASAAELRSVLREAEAEEGPARSFALFARGFAHEHGVAGAKRDAHAATALYRRAAAGGGTAAALLALGWMLDAASGGPAEQQDARESQRSYERAAALGNAQAMVNVACTIAEGQQPDHHAVAALYRRAAALGHDSAQIALARMALEGTGGVEGGVDEAIALLGAAVASGRTDAAVMLGKLLARTEFGAQQDVREASRMWKLAGSQQLLSSLAAK
eukprot:m51a1_g4436 hypothetical protein (596) ;mRNA; f:94009-96986